MEVITSHIQADFDAFASMIAARMLYPEAVLAFPGAQEKNLRDYIANADEEITGHIVKLKNINLEEITRLIIVDTRQLSRIGDFSQIIGRQGVEVIIYDHHPSSDDDIQVNIEHLRELGSNIAIMVDILKEKGAKIVHEEHWGLKRLAYPIQKKSTGFYHLIEYTAEGDLINGLEVAYKRDEKILRFLTVKLDKHAIAYNEKKRRKAKEAKEEEK